jgi:two-component system OmpR family response regulator
MEHSGILLILVEDAEREILSALLQAGGEKAVGSQGVAASLDAMVSGSYDLIIADADRVSDLRAAAGGTRSVPILAISQTDVAGADATLARPFRADALTAAVRACLGSDRMPIPFNHQRDMIADLIGAEQAAAMIGRYLDGLAAGIDEIEAGGDARAIGHRLGGLGGMLGFSALGTAWLSLEEYGMAGWASVHALTMEAIERHRETSRPVGGDGLGT